MICVGSADLQFLRLQSATIELAIELFHYVEGSFRQFQRSCNMCESRVRWLQFFLREFPITNTNTTDEDNETSC